MMQKADTSVCDWSVCTVSYTPYANIQRVLLRVVSNLVPLYSLIVAEEELMNVAESPLRTGEETGEKRRGEKRWRGGGVVEGLSLGQLS